MKDEKERNPRAFERYSSEQSVQRWHDVPTTPRQPKLKNDKVNEQQSDPFHPFIPTDSRFLNRP